MPSAGPSRAPRLYVVVDALPAVFWRIDCDGVRVRTSHLHAQVPLFPLLHFLSVSLPALVQPTPGQATAGSRWARRPLAELRPRRRFWDFPPGQRSGGNRCDRPLRSAACASVVKDEVPRFRTRGERHPVAVLRVADSPTQIRWGPGADPLLFFCVSNQPVGEGVARGSPGRNLPLGLTNPNSRLAPRELYSTGSSTVMMADKPQALSAGFKPNPRQRSASLARTLVPRPG